MLTAVIVAASFAVAHTVPATAQQLSTIHPAVKKPTLPFKGVVERGPVRKLPAAPVSQRPGRCQPGICCEIVMGFKCDGASGWTCTQAGSHYGCGRKYNSAGDDQGCCTVMEI